MTDYELTGPLWDKHDKAVKRYVRIIGSCLPRDIVPEGKERFLQEIRQHLSRVWFDGRASNWTTESRYTLPKTLEECQDEVRELREQLLDDKRQTQATVYLQHVHYMASFLIGLRDGTTAEDLTLEEACKRTFSILDMGLDAGRYLREWLIFEQNRSDNRARLMLDYKDTLQQIADLDGPAAEIARAKLGKDYVPKAVTAEKQVESAEEGAGAMVPR